MHADQIETDAALVHRLLAGQFPAWAGLPIHPVAAYGTDHDIYRLGDQLAARLPRATPSTGPCASGCPVRTPNGTFDDLSHAAVDLAAFVTALRQVDTTGAPPRPAHGRGGPLEEFDQQVRRSIAQLGVRIDGQSRLRFRTELRVDDASWSRGRGWAFYQAVSALAYYRDTNPGMIGQASRGLSQLLAGIP